MIGEQCRFCFVARTGLAICVVGLIVFAGLDLLQ